MDQSSWGVDGGELNIAALVTAEFVIPASEITDSLKIQQDIVGDSMA